MFDVNAMRHMNRIFHGDLHAFVLRIPCGDRDGIRTRVHLNRNALEIGFLLLRRFYGVNFHLVAVPSLNVNSAVDVLQLERAARLQRHRLVEVFADGVARSGPKSSHKKKGKTKSCRAKTVP